LHGSRLSDAGAEAERFVDGVRKTGEPSRVFELKLTQLQQMRFLAEVARSLFNCMARASVIPEPGKVQEHGASIVCFESQAYPQPLRQI